MSARISDLAGSWYPDTAEGCRREIERYVADDRFSDVTGGDAIGGIVPHAGWFFSGSLACHVIRCLAAGPTPDIFVIYGMHLHPGSSCYIMAEGEWETPLGNLSIESELAGELIAAFDFRIETADRHTPDNTIEIQLPLIRYFFPEVPIVPVGVPPTDIARKIGTATAEIAGALGKQVCVLGSTDLTHYGANYGFTSQGSGPKAVEWARNVNDRRLIEAIEKMDPDAVISGAMANQNACCAGAVSAAICAAERLGAKRATTLGYASSYDKHPNDSFVGYVGVVFQK